MASVTRKDMTISGYAEKVIDEQMRMLDAGMYVAGGNDDHDQTGENWLRDQVRAMEESYRSLHDSNWRNLVWGWGEPPGEFLNLRLDPEAFSDREGRFPEVRAFDEVYDTTDVDIITSRAVGWEMRAAWS